MDETRYQLAKSGTATLGSAGAAVLEFQAGVNERWVIKLFNTSGNSTQEPHCRVTRRGGSAEQLDFTTRGNGDTSPVSSDIEIRQGDGIRVIYSGGTTGAIMTFSIEGDLMVRGRRAY